MFISKIINNSDIYLDIKNIIKNLLSQNQPNEFKHVVPPESLAEIADVKLIFESESGLVYSVQAKP